MYLHTHAGCYRAIKLYSDFGFALLTEPAVIDGRPNEVTESLPYLREHMPPEDYCRLQLTTPDPE